MRKFLCLTISLVLFYGMTFAQTVISGTVNDDDGQPLEGVAVLVKNTTIGVFTGPTGTYSLEVPDGSEALIFSLVGRKSQEVPITGQASINVTLSDDPLQLEEVVVTGYTSTQRKNLTGAVSSVKAADIQNIQLPSIETALQGRAAGVTVVKNSGKPGGGIDVNIRGRTSITASNQPLYVVDGIPIVNGDNFDFAQQGIGGSNVSVLSDLNPEDIESIEILKDAATAAAYGSRAANGVVLITTKNGSKDGSTTVKVNGSYGGQDIPNQIEGITGPEYQDYIVEIWQPFLEANGLEVSYQSVQDNILGPLGNANTNWQDEIFQTGIMRDINVSISGGNSKTQFFASGGYDDQEGAIRNSRFERYSGRLNVNHTTANDKLRFGMSMGYSNSNTQQVQNDNNIFGALGAALLTPPTIPVFNDDGTFGRAFGIENAVAATTVYENNIIRGRLLGNVNATYNILENLSIRTSFGIDLINQREEIFEPSILQSSANGIGIIATVDNTRFINDYVINYNEDLFGGNITTYAGTSFQEDEIKTTFTEVANFPTDQFTGLTSGAEPVTTDGDFTGDNLISFFGGLNYDFGDKYFFTANIRADGSSRFVNERWGVFPGFSAGWNLANEPFLANGPFNLLKVRFGWGQTGNNVIDNFASRQLYIGGENFRDAPGTAPGTPDNELQTGNTDLQWETTTQTNVGIDVSFLNERIVANLDFYVKNTDDLLLARPIPTTSGFTSVLQNIGEVENRGIDLTINSVNINNNFINWTTTLTISYLENEVIRLVDGAPIDAGFSNRIIEGQPLGSFFGSVTDGIFQNQAEIDAAATQPNAAPGDIRFRDISGGPGEDGILGTADDLAPDGVINDNDRDIIGKSLPDWQGGITNNITFFGVEINAFFQFATGFQIYNNNRAFTEGLNGVFSPTRNAFENRWRQEGDITEIPRLIRNDPNNNRRDSDRFLEDGDYIRLKTLTVGYNIPQSVLSPVGIKGLKIYFSGFNLWTETGYTGYDPEVNIFDGSNTALGTDFLTYPQTRVFVGGLNLTL